MKLFVVLLLTIQCGVVFGAMDSSEEFGVFGWVNAELGSGKRYGDASGKDRLGASQMAIGVKGKAEGVTFIGVVGDDALSTSDGDADGDGDAGDSGFKIRDAFVVIDNIKGSQFGLSMGAQPFLFGLKANGFPGDRSLQPSIEYGGTGGFNASQQDGGSLIVFYDMKDMMKVNLGVFDTNQMNTPTGTDPVMGSKISDNMFLGVNFHQLGLAGLYGFAGFESRYVGMAVDESKPIMDLALGFKKGMFDFSVEHIQMDKAFSGTLEDEKYLVAELTVSWNEGKCSFYADYGNATEAESSTIRVGTTMSVTKHLMAQLEYSMDDLKEPTTGDSLDVDSVDFRLKAHF